MSFVLFITIVGKLSLATIRSADWMNDTTVGEFQTVVKSAVCVKFYKYAVIRIIVKPNQIKSNDN